MFILGEVAVQKVFGGSQFFGDLVGIGVDIDLMLFGYPTFQGYAQLVCPIQYRLWVGFLFCCYFFLRFGYGLFLCLRLLVLLAGIDNEACLDAVIDYASGDVNLIDGVSEDKQVVGDA